MAVSLGLHVIEDYTPPSPLLSPLLSSSYSADTGRGSSYGHNSSGDSSVRGDSNGSSREGEGGGGEGRGESGSGGYTCPELSILLKPILSIRQYITLLVDYVSSGKRHYTLLVTRMCTHIYSVV